MQLLRRFDLFIKPALKFIRRATQRYNADKHYRKHFTLDHIKDLLYFHVSSEESLCGLEQALKEDEHVKQTVDSTSPSKSRLSEQNKRRDVRVFRDVFAKLFKRAQGLATCPVKELKSLLKVRIFDPTLITCTASMFWAKYKKTAQAVKAHMVLSLKQLPEKLILTQADTDDKRVLKRLIFKGFTYIFDRGFNCYTFFESIHTKMAFFITRLCENAVYTVEETLAEAATTTVGVLKDQLILLGQGQTRISKVFRLITYRAADNRVYLFLTNRFDLDAQVIADLYKFRWSIEIFFRWMKRYLKFDRLIARNENGLQIQLYSALITFLLLEIYFKKIYGIAYPTLEALRRFRYTMHDVVSDQDYNSCSVSFDSS